MKIIERATTPSGTTIQLEDWSERYFGIRGLIIAVYPIARNSNTPYITVGKIFRFEICSDDAKSDFEALKNGGKSLEDLSKYFINGKRDKLFLGMTA